MNIEWKFDLPWENVGFKRCRVMDWDVDTMSVGLQPVRRESERERTTAHRNGEIGKHVVQSSVLSWLTGRKSCSKALAPECDNNSQIRSARRKFEPTLKILRCKRRTHCKHNARSKPQIDQFVKAELLLLFDWWPFCLQRLRFGNIFFSINTN